MKTFNIGNFAVITAALVGISACGPGQQPARPNPPVAVATNAMVGMGCVPLALTGGKIAFQGYGAHVGFISMNFGKFPNGTSTGQVIMASSPATTPNAPGALVGTSATNSSITMYLTSTLPGTTVAQNPALNPQYPQQNPAYNNPYNNPYMNQNQGTSVSGVIQISQNDIQMSGVYNNSQYLPNMGYPNTGYANGGISAGFNYNFGYNTGYNTAYNNGYPSMNYPNMGYPQPGMPMQPGMAPQQAQGMCASGVGILSYMDQGKGQLNQGTVWVFLNNNPSTYVKFSI